MTVPTGFAEALARALGAEPGTPCLGQYRGRGSLEWRTRGAVLADARMIATGLRMAGIRAGEPCLVVPVVDGEVDAAGVVAGCILAECPPLVLPAADGGLGENVALLGRALAITDARAVLLASTDPRARGVVAGMVEAAGMRARVLDLSALRNGTARLDHAPRANRIAACHAMQLTSGTTGSSRVCVWSGGGMRTAMAGIVSAMELGRRDRLFNWSGLHHTVGVLNNLLVGLFHGIPAVFMSPQRFADDPVSWLDGLGESGATITAAPNFAFRQTADHVTAGALQRLSLSGVRAFWNTGERVLGSSIRAFHDRLGPAGLRIEALRANYGLAENTGGATFSAIGAVPLLIETLDADRLDAAGRAEPWAVGVRRAEAATVGAPWPGLSVVIRGEAGAVLPEGHVGEIALATPSRFEGYCNDAEATAAVLDGDLLLTGDLGYMRGGQLFWIGRGKEVINVRGRKIDPTEFLPIVEAVEGVDSGRYVAFGVVDAARGTERLVLAIEVPDPGADHRAVLRAMRRGVVRELGVGVDDIVLLPPRTIETTISGKRRHRYYKQLYEAGGLDPLRLTPR